MNYDSMLIELFGRVQELERQVKALTMDRQQNNDNTDYVTKKVTTNDIFDFVLQQKEMAKERGEESIVLRAGDIAKDMHLTNRIPMVVNAMKRAMSNAKDEIIFETPSGFSTTIEIKYFLYEEEKRKSMKGCENKFVIKRAISPKSLPAIKVFAGKENMMAFDKNEMCVGAVYEHFKNRGSTANHQAEICFFDEYFNSYGKWHLMKNGYNKERIMYRDLEKTVSDQAEYEYIGYIRARR